MFENTVVLTKEEDESLLRKAERIAVLEKLLKASRYVTVEECARVLDIKVGGADDVLD